MWHQHERGTNTEVGAFGIGAKAAFAVSPQFTVTGVKDGVKVNALFALNEDGVISSGELDQEALAHEFPELSPEAIAAAAAPTDTETSFSSTPPPLPTVVFLRGAGVASRVFDQASAALWERGLLTTTNRTQAMHLSRGGLAVWLLDFSVPKDTDPAATPVSVGKCGPWLTTSASEWNSNVSTAAESTARCVTETSTNKCWLIWSWQRSRRP